MERARVSRRWSLSLVGLGLIVQLGTPERAFAQAASTQPGGRLPGWMAAILDQVARVPPAAGFTSPQTPRVIPQLDLTPDPSGTLGTYQAGGPTTTSGNAF